MPGVDDPRIPEVPLPASLPEFNYADTQREERIGTGGDADVYRATVEHDGRTHRVAVKTPRFEGTISKQVVEQFENEAKTWDSLSDHENIVSVYAWGTEPLPWLALEYMDGGTLEGKLGTVDIEEALWLSGRIADGVHHGHRHGVAHLDIKPTNVLLRETGPETWDYPKVSDWGLAKMLLEHSNSIEGLSPQYAAPEQFDTDEYGSPDDITDIYQLGVVVYALLTGKPPFTGSSAAVMRGVLDEEPPRPSEVNTDVPSEVDDIVMEALSKEKAERYESVVILRKELDRLFEEYMGSDTVETSASAAPKTSVSRDKPTKEDTSQEGEVATDNKKAVKTDSQSQSRSTKRKDKEASSRSAAQANDDDSSLVSRRQALGLLGIGVLGGGWLAATQMGGDDGSSPSTLTDTESEVPTETPAETDTETSTEAEADAETAEEIDGDDGINGETSSEEEMIIDDFESGNLNDWKTQEGQSLDITTNAVSGEYAAKVPSQTHAFVRFDSVTPSELSFWWKSEAVSDNELSISLHEFAEDEWATRDTTGFGIETGAENDSIIVAIPPFENTTSYIPLYAQPKTDTWYRARFFNIDFQNNVCDVAIYNRSGTQLGEVIDHSFENDISSIGYFRIKNNMNFSKASAYIDSIVATL